jgi:hypothetical protein
MWFQACETVYIEKAECFSHPRDERSLAAILIERISGWEFGGNLVQEQLPIQRIPSFRHEPGIAVHPAQLFFGGAVGNACGPGLRQSAIMSLRWALLLICLYPH